MSIDRAPPRIEGKIGFLRGFARGGGGKLQAVAVGKGVLPEYMVRPERVNTLGWPTRYRLERVLQGYGSRRTVIGRLPCIDLVSEEGVSLFKADRRQISLIQDDLFELFSSKSHLGTADIVFIRNVCGLYGLGNTKRLLRQAMEYGRNSGFHLVWEDIVPKKGYPICMGLVLKINPLSPSESNVCAIKLRSGFFRPEEIFFASQWFNLTECKTPGMRQVERGGAGELVYRMLNSR